MECARQRRTFVAVSFKTANSRPESAYSLSYVFYKNDKLEKEGFVRFKPLNGQTRRVGKVESFEIAFENIRPLITAKDIPVITWDDKSINIFNTLILGSGNGILMQRPPRYFRLRDYAIFRIGKVASDWAWDRIAKHYKMNSAPCREPDAAHIAALMIKVEDQINFPSIVAKAFCKFCDSILDDGVVTVNEATELRSFVLLISNKYPEFKKLEIELEKVLEDEVVTKEESDRLVRILTGMSKYYAKFIDEKVVKKM